MKIRINHLYLPVDKILSFSYFDGYYVQIMARVDDTSDDPTPLNLTPPVSSRRCYLYMLQDKITIRGTR